MNLPKYAIENHQFTIIITVLLILMGVVSYVTMPRSEDPQVTEAGASVLVVFPGANPIDIEQLIVDPVEEVLNELEEVKTIRSGARDGYATIEVEFESGADPDDKYSDVVQKVNSIRNKLPEQILDLEILKWSVSDVCIFQFALISDKADYFSLQKEAERLEKLIEVVPGVKKAEVEAYPEREVRISADLMKMKEMGISFNSVANSVLASNQNIPGGNIDIGGKKFNILTSGSFNSIDELRNTIIKANNGRIVFLKDIADVNFAYADNKYRARFNGQKAVYIKVEQKERTNIFDIAEGVKQKTEIFKEKLPEEMKLEIIFDQSESVNTRMGDFFGNLWQGLLLVGIVMFFAVNFRSAMVVMLAIPTSIFIGIGFVDLSGYGIEQMTIAGLVIALGMLVDNSIVVTQNISRFMKLGYSPKEAAIKGTSQIGWAVVNSTITTLLAFVPIIMMQNITGEFIRSMPVTVVFTLSASLLIALTLTPYITSKFVKPGDKDENNRFRNWMDRFIEGKYGGALKYSIENPKRILIYAFSVLILSIVIFQFVGISFFPKAEKPMFLVNIDAPDGTSIDKTESITYFVEKILKEEPLIKNYTVNTGHGNPRIYYNVFPKREAENHSQFLVNLNESSLGEQQNLIFRLREIFKEYPGAKIGVKELEQGPPISAPIEIKLIGDDLKELEKVANDTEKIFRKTKGVININNPLTTSKTDLHVNINKAKAAMYGVPLAEIDKTVRAAIAGMPVSEFRDNEGKEYKIIMKLDVNEKPVVDDFNKIFVSSFAGTQIPLNQLASIEFKASPMIINHFNLQRNVSVTADVNSTTTVDLATKEIISELEKYEMPKNMSFYIGGEKEQQEESFGGMMQAVIIAIVGIFGVLVLQFKSYSQPWIVFTAIPLAIIGAVLGLFLTGNSFSFAAFIGLTSLVGIVVNNSIILVDYTNQLRQEGTDLMEALIEAGKTRFTPIILTTSTTIGGLLPLTLTGGTMWAPMGWVIIGGLTVSTCLTLLVVPAIYKLFSAKNVESV